MLRGEHGYLWKVQCHLNVDSKGLKRKEMTLHAHNVILGAGSLGSTQILLKSKTDGLEISNTIGSRFTGNGDALGFCYDSSMELNAMGSETGKYDQVKNTSPGPCITTVIDFRHNKSKFDENEGKTHEEKDVKIKDKAKRESAINENADDPFENDIIIEDGTPPGALSKLLKVVLFLDSVKDGKHVFPKPGEFEKIFQVIDGSCYWGRGDWGRGENFFKNIEFNYLSLYFYLKILVSPTFCKGYVQPNFQSTLIVVF